MCNAKSHRKSADELTGFGLELGLKFSGDVPPFPPRYRIGPRQRHVIFIVDEEGLVRPTIAVWDLIPPGKAKPFLRTNARADGLRTTWPWKSLLRKRCLVPADGFYEPEKPARTKGTVPWSFYARKDGGLFMMAGLFNETTDPDTGEIITSYTVITTEANAVIQIHDRMPVILEPADCRLWLEADDLPETVLRPYPADGMTGWRVTDEARNSRVPENPGMVEPVEDVETEVQTSLF